MVYDVLIHGARYFDGTGAASRICSIGIAGGKVVKVGEIDPDKADAARVIEASGKWLMPGFIDAHTHYDAELIVAPSLSESVRHGVTTALVGSCSLSMVCSDYEDASDIFTRVETVPREKVLPILKARKTWRSPQEWVAFVNEQPLGPNLISLLGHSDMRVAVMGLERATDRAVVPDEAELQQMESLLTEAMDHGFLGLSTMCLKWDKIDGDRAWSRSLPSTYARWGELRRLNRLLRRYDGVHQGAPNAASPFQVIQYLWECMGLWRKPLKTTLISLMDLKGNATLRPMAQLASKVTNFFKGDFRWQLLPTPFTVYADGIDVVFFEEFGAGEMALDLKDKLERDSLLKDETYRRNFRKFYGEKLSPRVWQRDFSDAIILECPDESVVGKDFSTVAKERGIHEVDLFLDLVVAYGTDLRWYTTVANNRADVLDEMLKDKDTLITFSDAGAHIRNMAFYNLPLRFLQRVLQSHERGKPIMSIERAVHRLTGEQADWFGVPLGTIREGDRADLLLLDPDAFDQNLEAVSWAEMQNFELQRLVNRNPGLVPLVMINGKIACEDGAVSEALGRDKGFGEFIPARR